MNDFEVHPIGTSRELRLSRALAQAIAQIDSQYRNVVPLSVMKAYDDLFKYYQEQLERENNE